MQQTFNSNAVIERKRKFLLVLPLLVFPFFTFLAWSVGLFGSDKAKAANATAQHGFNMHLPDAKLKENKSWNKLDFYDRADQDSAKLKEAMKNDPYYKQSPAAVQGNAANPYQFSYDPSPSAVQKYQDPNVEKVNQKLNELKAVLNQPPKTTQSENATVTTQQSPSMNSQDIDRLQSMMKTMNQKDGGSDPEMQQLTGMMDKLLDIQHPERVQERLREQSKKNKGQVFPVAASNNEQAVTVLQTKQQSDTGTKTNARNGFYSLEETTVLPEEQNAISAVVAETQSLVSGATVKLRLLDDVYIRGISVPKNQFVYGTASLNGERLNIAISSIRYQNNLLPVSLSVYDVDGNAGINIPGSISRDVAKQSAGESISSMGVMSVDPSFGAQAASAGINAAKTLLSKKAKLVKVTLKQGYQVLLKDNNNKQ